MTQEHTKLIFDFTCQNLKADLATLELDTRMSWVAVEKEAKL